MSTEIERKELLGDGMGLQLVDDPEAIVTRATRACESLMKIVEAKQLYQEFGVGKNKKRHLLVEAWLLLARFHGVVPRTESVVSVQDDVTGHFGFEATVEAVDASGVVRGRAIARCMSNEENWGMVTKYKWENEVRTEVGERQKAMQQLESMAQTRATSKVMASLFRHIVILGDKKVSGTPAEEMVTPGGEKKPKPEEGAPQRITDAQRKRLFAKMHEANRPLEELPEILKRYGFAQAFEVTRDKYDTVIAEIVGQKGTQTPP